MTDSQRAMYHARANEARAAMARHGRVYTSDEWQAVRYAIHEEAGAPPYTSSKQLSNAQLDRVLAIYASWSHDTDLRMQMELDEQPQRRCRWLVDRCLDRIEAHLDALNRGPEADSIRPGPAREGWILAMLRRMGGPKHHLDPLDASPVIWRRVIAATYIRYDQVSRKKPCRAVAQRTRPFDVAMPL